MIKIIEPIEKENKIKCKRCNTLLSYTENDLENFSCEQGFECPKCGEWVVVKKSPPFEFPISYYHFSKECGASDISKERIQKFVDTGVKCARESKEEFDYVVTGTGDVLVVVIKNDEGITCYVTKDYYEAWEPYEDYK